MSKNGVLEKYGFDYSIGVLEIFQQGQISIFIKFIAPMLLILMSL